MLINDPKGSLNALLIKAKLLVPLKLYIDLIVVHNEQRAQHSFNLQRRHSNPQALTA